MSAAGLAGSPINILIVDDEPKNLAVLESLLDHPDYRLVRARSGDEALLALVAEEFALLILDIRMPGMSGLELAQTIKARRKTASVPIIFLTAYYNEDQHVIDGYDTGAVDYLQKPVNAAVLRSKVAVFAELHRKSHELVVANRALLSELAERRSVETQLRELNTELDLRVAERTQALSASDARLRLATDAVRLGIWSWHLAHDIWVWENEWFQTVLGVSGDAVPRSAQRIGADFVHPEDRPAFQRAIEASARGGVALNFECRLRRADGALRWVEFVGDRSAGAGSAGTLLGSTRDTTRRRLAEQQLRERERFLSAVTGAARVGLAVVEPGNVYRYCNHAFASMLGLAPGPIGGQRAADYLVKRAEPPQAPLQRAFTGERVSFEFTLPGRAPEDKPRHFGAFLEPHLETTPSVVVVLIELSAMKQLESELRDTDRRKDEFLATLAHELRNPLAPLRSAVQMLRLKGTDDPEQRWAQDLIERQVVVMARLIDDLMDVSRINQGRIELKKTRVDLRTVLNWAIEASRSHIEEFGHRLSVEIPADELPLDADLMRLSQVFMNVLVNAAKYTDHGGRIVVSVQRRADEVMVSVTDNGIGIAADKLAQVFVMFSQVEDSLSRARGGLGIGLTLAQHLVRLHGGRVEAHSDGIGRGSRFSVFLPLQQGPLPAPAPPAAADDSGAAPAGPPGLRILVVDDNRDAAESLSMLLAMLGHEVRVAHDGEQGLALASSFRPQVVLLDIGLPRLNGYEVCRRIRQEPWGRTMKLIATTGWGDDKARLRAAAAGFDLHMTKPVDPDRLVAVFKELTAAPGVDSRP